MATNRTGIEKNDEGMKLLHAGEYERALEGFTKAIELYPGFVGAYQNRAEAYRKLGRERDAQRDLAKISSLLQARRRDAVRERLETGPGHRAEGYIVSNWSGALLSEIGTITIGPGQISFRHLAIPAETVTNVAAFTWSWWLRAVSTRHWWLLASFFVALLVILLATAIQPFWVIVRLRHPPYYARLLVEYLDPLTSRTKSAYFDARERREFSDTMSHWVWFFVPWLGGLVFASISNQLKAIEVERRDIWVARIEGLRSDAQLAAREGKSVS